MRTDDNRAMFRDRRDAGRILAASLLPWQDHPVILGVPRGGVVVADEVAASLGAELDIVSARKLGAPGQPELAIGAVCADGTAFFNEELIATLGVSQSYLATELERQRGVARRRAADLRGVRPPVPLEGRVVIIVDDGLATGATVRAAVRFARAQRPGRVIAAAPVGSSQACGELRLEADEVVCPREERDLGAIGYYYLNFQPVSDNEVRRVLQAHAVPAPAGSTIP